MRRPRSGPGWGKVSFLILGIAPLFFTLGSSALFAQPPEKAPAQSPPAATTEQTSPPRIYVPYKSLTDLLGADNPTIFLPLKEFNALWEKVRRQVPPLPVSAVLTQATYTATATPTTLQVTGDLALQSTSKTWSKLPLDFGTGKLADAKWSDPRLILHTNSSGQPELLIPAAGAFTGKLTIVYSVTEASAQQQARVKLPTAAASILELTIPTADQSIRVEPSLPLTTSGTSQATTAKVTLGRTADLQLSWNSKTSPTTPVNRLLTAERITRIVLEEGTAHTDSRIQWQVYQGITTQLRIALPLTHKVLDVTIPNLKAWNLQKEEKRQILVVDLVSPLQSGATLLFQTEFPFTADTAWGGTDAAGKTQGIELLDIHREQGLLILQSTPDLAINVENPQGLVRVGAEEIPEPYRKGETVPFRFFSTRQQLKFSVKPIESRISARSRTNLLLSADQIRITAAFDYDIERAGLFSLNYKLPAGMKLEAVRCSDLQDQILSPQGDQLKLTLAQRKLGHLHVEIEGRISQDTVVPALKAPLIEPQNVPLEEGIVSVQGSEGLEIVTDPKGVKSAQPVNSDEAPQSEFRIASTWSFNHRPVEIPLSISRKPPRLTAQTATTLNLRQKLLEVSTLLKLHVDYSGLRQFQFLLPEAVGSSLQIEEPDGNKGLIKQKTSAKSSEAGWTLWTIETQREVLGDTQFRLRYDIPLQDTAGTVQPELKLPRLLLATPAAGQTIPAAVSGEIAVVKDEAWSLTAEVAGLELIDVRELQQLPRTAAMAYRYYEAPAQVMSLKLLATKYETRDVVQTVITRALVEGVLTFEDQGLFCCRYRLTTSERQRLPVQLPAQVEPLSVSVAGQQVPLERSANAKPEDGTFFINVNRQTAVDQPFMITIVYRAKVRPISRRGLGGDFKLQLPQLGILPNHAHPALQQQRLIVWVPRDVELVGESDHFKRRPPDHFHRDPQALAAELDSWISQAPGEVYEFPVSGHPFEYDSIGSVRELSVQWWRMNWITIIVTIPLVLVALLLRRTSVSNKLGLVLFFGFFLLLAGQQDLDWVRHLIFAGRFGLIAGLVIWILCGITKALRQDATSPAGMTVPWGQVMAPVIPPPTSSRPNVTPPLSEESSKPPAS